MKSIALIIPYFGTFRKDFSFWTKSVELNPSVDFILLTDQTNISFSQNIKIIKINFAEFKNVVKRHFDFNIALPQPYKMCDFRPAYGEIFHEYIKDYDFWGHCDNDQIFGDIRHFITDDILNKYDRILIRGHFTLYRNTPTVNKIYKNVSPLSYKNVFSSSKNFCFDETPGTGIYWMKVLNDRLYNKIIFDDINYKRHEFITVHKKELDKGRKHFIYSFENGKLFRVFEQNGKVGKEEIMYVHFQKRNLSIQTEASNYFTIVPNKIITYVSNPSIEFLRKEACKKLFYWPLLHIKLRTLKRKIIALFRK